MKWFSKCAWNLKNIKWKRETETCGVVMVVMSYETKKGKQTNKNMIVPCQSHVCMGESSDIEICFQKAEIL